MPTPEAKTYAELWVRAWNAHDIEAVLDHFHDDVLFTSPVAARVLPETEGVVRGKDALRHYWARALKSLPDLHFEIIRCLPRCVHAGDQLSQSSRRTGERGAHIRRRRPGP
jgi:hypothetical protein